jgi:two-component system response regulator FlrC
MDLFASESFDAVLSDVQMPGMDGHSLMRWVAETHPTVHAVLMSGYDLCCGDCPFAGRCKLLQKPFMPAVAVATIGQVLRQPVN